MPLAIGGKAIPWLSLCVISSGPSWASFFSVVQPKPPQANPITPTMISTMPTTTAGFISSSLQWPSPLDQIDNQYHNRDDEQDVNKPAERVGADQSKQPQDQQNNKYCPEHRVVPFG